MHLALRSPHFITRRVPAARGVPALGLLLLLGGCGSASVPSVDAGAWMPFSANRNIVTSDSVTVQRLRGANPEVAPIEAEPGNVWPEPERDRPTLLSGPDEAMRNIPEYRPMLTDPLAGSRPPVAGMPGRPGASAAPPAEPQRFPVNPPATAPTPPAPRAEGQVLTSPSGRPAVVTGEAGRVRGVTQPGVGGGAVIRDGNVETWIGPDGRTNTRVVPQ
jgi:hypothetical protein